MNPTEYRVITAWICPICKHTITEKPITEDKILEHLSLHQCAECGAKLESFEVAREAKGKFSGLCNDCTALKLGLR